MNRIEAINLSKKYELQTSKSFSLKEFVLKDVFRRTKRRTLWALRDISFSLEEGKTLGIIGGNGSGKTTLLRLIAGITEPTGGELRVNGRTTAILELGVGFHPELNAIENIYLNGAMLGIPRWQLDKSLDNILDFAELRQFCYMPLKHYSSGMFLRLGFSIALNIDPDILLIDEVLAVGDVRFQQKSLKKICEFKQRGKTIVFVTHNLDQAEMLCDEIIWLDKGEIRAQGKSDEVINNYILHAQRLHREFPIQPFNYEHAVMFYVGRYGTGAVTIEDVLIKREDGRLARQIPPHIPFSIELHYCLHKPVTEFDCQIGLRRIDGANVCLCSSASAGIIIKPASKRGKIIATFNPPVFQSGKYLVSLSLCPPNEPLNPYDMQLRMYTFNIGNTTEETEQLLPAVFLPAEIILEQYG
ncbi:MAG: ABC transporter ATP-binding protein [Candidatus Sumerlaeia bacterium]|nr:ABC transporter ATP-binding protein [Candidatus Sumerlaeia bacterium]